MLKYLILLLLYPTFIFPQISNFQLERTFDRGVQYRATFHEHNGRLYVDASGAVEEYDILPNGELEILNYIEKYIHSPAHSIIIGDSLYIVDYIMDVESRILTIDISGLTMSLINTFSIPETPEDFLLDMLFGNSDYLFYHHSGNNYTQVIDRFSYENLCNLQTGAYFAIKDSLLFVEMVNGNESAISIQDISDIYNPTEITMLYTGLYEENHSYFFQDSLLFIGRSTEIIIVNLADINSPYIISRICNIPNIPYPNFVLNQIIYNDYLIFSNQNGCLWIYDISDSFFPIFVNYHSFDISDNYKPPLIKVDEYFYYATLNSNIYQFNGSALPEFYIVGEYGKSDYFSTYFYSHPFLIYTSEKTLYLNVEDIEPSIYQLSNCYHTGFSKNDSLLFSIKLTESSNFLNIHDYSNDIMELKLEYDLNSTNYLKTDYNDPYLFISDRANQFIKIFSINPDFSIEMIYVLFFNSPAFLCEKNNDVYPEYNFIRYQENDNIYVSIVQNQIPFNQVGSFDLDQFSGNDKRLYLLSENRVLVISDYMMPNPIAYLCDYIFPDVLVILDIEMISNDGSIQLYDDFFVSTRYYDGYTYYYKWNNDRFDMIYYFDFTVANAGTYFSVNSNRLFSYGIHYIKEYFYDYVSVYKPNLPDYSTLIYNLTNYPNPFNPSTTISFSIEQNEQNQQVELCIFNIKGQKVKTLIDAVVSATEISCTWNGKDESGKRVSSGEYIASLTINGEEKAVRKMMVVK